MTTEKTETFRGWVFYDADCALCRGWAGRSHDLLLRHGYHLAPLQAPWVKGCLEQSSDFKPSQSRRRRGDESQIIRKEKSQSETPDGRVAQITERGCVGPLTSRSSPIFPILSRNTLLTEMKLLAADGRIFGGADALIRLTRSIWWAWPIFIFAQIPGIKPLMCVSYRSIARNRHCLGNRCQVAGPSTKHHRHLTSSFYEMP